MASFLKCTLAMFTWFIPWHQQLEWRAIACPTPNKRGMNVVMPPVVGVESNPTIIVTVQTCPDPETKLQSPVSWVYNPNKLVAKHSDDQTSANCKLQ